MPEGGKMDGAEGRCVPFLIIIRSVRNLFKIWMQEAAAGRKNLLAAFFYDSYKKNL